MENFLVLDIETFPLIRDDKLNLTMTHKTRNTPAEDREKKIKEISFLNPVYAKVFAIGVIDIREGLSPSEFVLFSRDDEYSVLKEFFNYIEKFPGLFVHYNGMDFDVPFLIARALFHNIDNVSAKFSNLIKYRNNPHYDVMQVLTAWGKFPISLREASYSFGIEDPKDILGGKETTDFLMTASDEDISDYVIGDCRSTYKMFEKLYNVYR